MLLVDALLDLRDGLSGVKALGADLGAVHDGVTPIQLVGVIQLSQPLLCKVISAVNDPSAFPIASQLWYASQQTTRSLQA